MKTAHYIFTTWNDSAMAAGFGGTVGGGRQAAAIRRSGRPLGGDNVIDLAAWRTASLEEPRDGADELDWEAGAPDGPELAVPAPRPRRSHRAMYIAELAATLGVAGFMAAMIVRVLLF